MLRRKNLKSLSQSCPFWRFLSTIFVESSVVVIVVLCLGNAHGYGYKRDPYGSLESSMAAPEIRLSRWVSSSDALESEWENQGGSSWDGMKWNSEIDTNAIHISGFGRQEYIVSEHVAAVRFECRARYPVQWKFHNALYVTEDLHGIQMRTFRRSESVTNPNSDTFIATLEIKMESNKATGNFTCHSTQSKPLAKNIFIFWEGTSPPYLVLSGKLLQIQLEDRSSSSLKPKADSVVLPCYVSNPGTSVRLFKESIGEFKEISSKSRISYNFSPQIGFTVSYRNFSDVLGRYRCFAGNTDDNDLMEVFVKSASKGAPSTTTSTCLFCLHRQLSPGTQFYFDPNTEELVCCGQSRVNARPTRLHVVFCSNPSICKMYEPAVYLISGGNGKRLKNGSSCVSERLYPRDYGLVKCKGEGIDVFSYLYTEFWTPEKEHLRAVFDWRELNPQNMVRIMIHSPSPYFHRQLVTATCQTLHSYFSDGIKWAIKWRNGSLAYFDSMLSSPEDIVEPRLHGIRSTYLRLSSFMAEIICLAPVWNSTDWVEKSLKLNVKPSQYPFIVGKPMEELTFGLNETDKILECASKAEPPAKIKWTKNDKEVPKNMIIWNENGTSVLMLKTVTYDTQAVYKCIAVNQVGHVRKIFRVFVEDTRHSTWSTAFAIVIPILVILSLGIFAGLMWKMQLQRKVVDHLTRVVFRETRDNT